LLRKHCQTVEVHLVDWYRRPAGDQSGFGLIEMVVAFTVLLVVLVATAELTTTVFGQAATTRAQVTATDLADQSLTELGADPLSQLQSDVNQTVYQSPVTLGGETFTIGDYLQWGDTGAPHSLCLTGSPPQIMQATVTVSWGGQHRLAETTVINPPYGQTQSQDGWLAVLVQGAASLAPSSSTTTSEQPPADVSAVGVSITPEGGSALAPLAPDASGCLYQPLAPGTYTVALQSPTTPAFVDNNNDPAPTQQDVTVTQGQATDVSFLYDQAGTVTFTGGTPTPPLASGMPVTVSNSGMAAGSQVVVTAGEAGVATAHLFPFPSSYSAWFGDCPSETPGSGWTDASSAAVTVSPGQAVSAVAGGLVDLDLEVSTTTGPVTATGTLADPSPSICPSETYGLGTVPVSGGTATLADQIIPEDYTVTVIAGSSSATVDLTWSGGDWHDTATGASYPPSSAIPVTVG